MRFETLQSLRGVACLAVVAYHVAAAEAGYGLGFNPLRPVLWFGYAGVDLFFVLSGFIIATTCRDGLGRPSRLPTYLFRRFWRVYPMYLMALVVAGLTIAALHHEPLLNADWPRELRDTLLLLPQSPVPRILRVAWTLSYEAQFYLAFGALFLLPRQVAAPLMGVWGVAVLACVAGTQAPANRFAALALSPFVLEFLAGCLVAWFPVALGPRSAASLMLIAALWCGIASFLFFKRDYTDLPMHIGRRVLTFGVPAALLVFAATGWERRSGCRGPRWLGAVGNASYSVYLFHISGLLLLQWVTIQLNFPHNRTGHLAWLALMLAAAIVPGLILHRYVETPLLKLGRKARDVPAEVKPPIRLAA